MCIPSAVCVWKSLFCWSHSSPLVLSEFLTSSPELRGGDFPSGIQCSCTLSNCRPQYWFPSALMTAQQDTNLLVQRFFIISPFNGLIVFSFPQDLSGLRSEPLWQCQAWVSSHRMGLKPKLEAVGYPCNVSPVCSSVLRPVAGLMVTFLPQ